MESLKNIFKQRVTASNDSKNVFLEFVDYGVFTAVIVLLFVYLWHRSGKKEYKLPPGPLGLPILGYLPFLGKESFRDFHRLSKKYGNVFSLYLGQSYIVVLGNYEAVKEAFSKSTTLNRPEGLFDFLPDGGGFGGYNGHQWVEMRRLAMKAMRDLGLGRNKWEDLVQEELKDFVKLIYSFEGKPFNIFQYITLSVSNNISSLVFGRRLPFNDQNLKFLTETLEHMFTHWSQTGYRNFFPVLHDTLSKLGLSSIAASRTDFEIFNNFIREQVEIQKKTYTPGSTENLVHEFLTEFKNNEGKTVEITYNESVLRANVQSIFLGGSDTTSLSLGWLMLSMAKYRDIQQKVQEELDKVLGEDDKIQYSERSKVPYTFAVILEGQRFRTIAPLNILRIASEDITIQGYDIPKGTLIMSNNWGIHNDAKYWKEPEKFIPERFLSEDGKEIIFKPDSFVPFSYGRRGCPGETVALIEILSYFVAIMKNFHVLPPENKIPIMDGIPGLTYQTLPQELCFIPRENSK